MLKVLIIDDEPIVRQGLKMIIPWQENGFEVCGECADFDDGIEKINTLNPDVVLTDIKMPGGFGTDLIRISTENGFKGKFIIISGYSNFEYAKTAIKYGVKSYILKPIDEDELLDIILKIKSEIISEKNNEETREMIKKIKLSRLIVEGVDELENKEYNFESIQLALIYTKNLFKIKNDYASVEKLIADKLVSYEDIEIMRLEDNIGLIFKNYNENFSIKVIKNLCRKIEKEFNIKMFVALGESIKSKANLRESYVRCKEILNKKFLYFEEEIMTLKKMISNEKLVNGKLEIDEFKLCNSVEVCDMEKLNSQLENIKMYFKINSPLEEKIKFDLIRIYEEIKDKLVSNYNLSDLELKNNKVVIHEIFEKESLDEAIEFIKEKLIIISKKIGETSSDSIIKKVINYIEKNYYKDIKLETIGELFNYNSAYLGKLFKSDVGESFNVYLDKIRIERAKKLLVEEKLKVYQVCEKVGYKNIDYFHSKFKKYVGISPMSYKKKNNDIVINSGMNNN